MRTLTGVNWHHTSQQPRNPVIGEHVYVTYHQPSESGPGKCSASITAPDPNDSYAKHNTAQGIVRKWFPPRKTSWCLLEVELTEDFLCNR
jgi:hypothetical protein